MLLNLGDIYRNLTYKSPTGAIFNGIGYPWTIKLGRDRNDVCSTHKLKYLIYDFDL